MAEEKSKSNKILKRFGKYLLLDHFVDGGMAKICRARNLDEQASKIMAIKMIQPQYSKDENFKKMFMDEVKVSFGLIHPNIAQTYDYGIQDEQLYTAMEYVDGKNLKQFLDKLKERNFVFPVELSVYIMTQVCQGLHYAHTFTDKLSGKKSHIIHRDISPHNIMLTYDGAVKVIDFGIAKAESNSDSTQAGTIKGKLSYLAPEYLENTQLDPRYDQFAVGITIWEMLCSRKLFKAQNEMAVLKAIQACHVPVPSSINPNVPKELDEIVLKALSKDRTSRYDNLDLMNRALNKFLYTHYPDFNSSDISYFAHELFKDDIQRDREILFEYGKIDIKPFIEDLKKSDVASVKKVSTDADGSPRKVAVLDFGFDEEAAKDKEKSSSKKNSDPKNQSGLQLEKRAAQKKQTDETNVKMKLKTGTHGSDEASRIRKESEKKKMMMKVVAVGAITASLVFLLGDFGESKKIKEDRRPSSVKQEVVVEPKQPVNREGLMTLTNFKKLKHRVFIDGVESPDVPFTGEIKVKTGKKYVLRIEDRQLKKKHFVREVSLLNDDPEVQVEIPEMGRGEFGYFVMSSACAEGKFKFTIEGEARVEKLPFTDPHGIPFPVGTSENGEFVPATYEVTVIDVNAIERKLSFTMKYPDDRVDMCEYIKH